MVGQCFATSSGVMSRPTRNIWPSAPLPAQLGEEAAADLEQAAGLLAPSWASQATSGLTYSGRRASMSSLGRTVSVRREPAIGAMVLTRTLYLRPSAASVKPRPTRPSLAVL
jgi:hypothetical protein